NSSASALSCFLALGILGAWLYQPPARPATDRLEADGNSTPPDGNSATTAGPAAATFASNAGAFSLPENVTRLPSAPRRAHWSGSTMPRPTFPLRRNTICSVVRVPTLDGSHSNKFSCPRLASQTLGQDGRNIGGAGQEGVDLRLGPSPTGPLQRHRH